MNFLAKAELISSIRREYRFTIPNDSYDWQKKTHYEKYRNFT